MMDYSQLYSTKVQTVKPSGIRKFFDIVAEMKDAISLGVGEPDFETPYLAKRGAIDAIKMGKTFYTSNWGLLELRQELSRYIEENFGLHYDPKSEIIATIGGSEAIDNAFRAYINPGDEVLIPEPSFVCYTPLTIIAGGVPVPIQTKEENQFRLTPEELKEHITPRTKLLVLPFPNNPTGGVMTREDLEAIAQVLRDTNILVLSDEIYSTLTYGEKHTCFAEIPGMRERTIVVNGFSKTFAMTGWRLGYAFGPKELIAPIVKIHQFGIMSAPTMSQFAGLEALRKCQEDAEEMRQKYDIRRRFLVSELNKMGLHCFEPKGAFYVFPSIKKTGLTSEEFCNRLLEQEKLAVVPGTAFGESGEGHVRISYSYSMEHLKEAVKRMKRFMEQFD